MISIIIIIIIPESWLFVWYISTSFGYRTQKKSFEFAFIRKGRSASNLLFESSIEFGWYFVRFCSESSLSKYTYLPMNTNEG